MPPASVLRKRPDLALRNRGDGGPYEDADWCRTRYESGMTYREIAAEAGCSLRTVARWFKLHGIEVPTAAQKRIQRGNQPKPRVAPPLCGCGAPKSRGSRIRTCAACRKREGAAGSNWRGEDIGCTQAHNRVRSAFGKASEHACGLCGVVARHWAYDHLDPNEKQSEDGPYSLDVNRYMALCAKCHKQFDMDYLRRMRR